MHTFKINQRSNLTLSSKSPLPAFSSLISILIALVAIGGSGCSPLSKQAPLQKNSPEIRNENHEILNFSKLDISSQLTSLKDEVRQEGSSFQLEFWRTQDTVENTGPSINPGFKVCVKPWMKMENGHQHGSYDTTPISIHFNENNGKFTVEPIFFSMSGDWELHIELCETELECKDEGYGGCPAGTLVDQAVKTVTVQ